MNQFSSKFFAQNRLSLLGKVKSPVVVVSANAQLQRNGDSSYPYRQDSNFWYLSGINDPGYVLVITKQESILIAPKLTRTQSVFDEQSGSEDILHTSGVDRLLENQQGWKLLKNLLAKHKKVATPRPSNLRHWGVTPNPARQMLVARLQRAQKGIDIEDIRTTMAHIRMAKQPEEIKAIQEAIDITQATLKDVFSRQWYKEYNTENEIEAAIAYGFRKRGAKGHAFGPVVAGGQAACTLHYQSNDRKLQKDTMLVVDVGAEVDNYAADISRTYAVGSQMSARQREVYRAVLDVQRFGMSQLKPGITVRECEKNVEKYMGEVLAKLGLINTQSRRAIRKYYPHAMSHMLGLDPHDAADYSVPLKPNMVLTVEPGIYIPEEGIGVRIEDDVIITKTGCKVLSSKLPASAN